MTQFNYRIAARTEAAGKYNPAAPREGNEDSFGILSDVGNSVASVAFDAVSPLPEKGLLMVVADGMGGHNAGEVASQIAIDTVREMFASDKITEKDCSTKESRAKYLEKVVTIADKNIRADADANPDRKGMGSTIVMTWVVGNELTVTWCGDSRAYRYHPGKSLEMLSEDHSLVQDLVRKKQLKYEDTFAHPQGNIITHCLGGGSKGNAEPESRQFTLESGDMIMLCSDGLSGVLFDDGRLRQNGEPYSDENIQDILSRKCEYLKDTLTCLFDAARRCDWYDNVTAILFEFGAAAVETNQTCVVETFQTEMPKKKEPFFTKCINVFKKCKRFIYAVAIIILAALSFVGGMLIQRSRGGEQNNEDTIIIEDTAITENIQTEESDGFEENEVVKQKKTMPVQNVSPEDNVVEVEPSANNELSLIQEVKN